ncbi:MAG: cation:proton antiporter [Anaerolineaceae bacterium]
MTPFLQLAFVIAIILLSAKTAGFLSTRLGQPSVLGELLIGLVLGPSLINLTHLSFITDPHIGEIIKEFGEIGVLLLMFLAGIELNLGELAENRGASAFGGIFGVVLPVALGFIYGELAGFEFSNSVFIGLTLGATSVSISAQTLMELKVLRSRVGLGLLGAAVFDDILIILLLSIFTALQSGGSLVEILLVFGKMLVFLAVSVGFGIWLLPRIVKKISNFPISQGLVTLALIVMLFYGIAAELLGGMAAITGTFVAGLMFSRTDEKKKIETGLAPLAYAFFVPIFFVNIGLEVNLRELSISALWVMLIISALAIIGKIIGSGLGAKLGGFSWLESLQLGVGMVSRGEVGLIVATVGLEAGLLNATIFSAIVGMVLVTTLVTPPLLRTSFAMKPKPQLATQSDSHKKEGE